MMKKRFFTNVVRTPLGLRESRSALSAQEHLRSLIEILWCLLGALLHRSYHPVLSTPSTVRLALHLPSRK